MGYFLSDRFLLGTGVEAVLIGGDGNNDGLLGITPFARFYLNPAAAGSHFFLQGSLSAYQELGGGGSSALGYNLSAGLTQLIGPGMALDARLAFSDIDFDTDDNNQLNIGLGLNVYLDPEAKANRCSAIPAVGRGSLMIGGTTGGLGFDFGNDITAINLHPVLAYFFTNRLAAGAGFTIDYYRWRGAEYSVTDLSISPLARYYFSQGRHRQWFVTGGVNIMRRSQNTPIFDDAEITYTQVDYSFGGGLNAFLTESVALEIGPNVRFYAEEEVARLGVDVGIQFFLNRKGE